MYFRHIIIFITLIINKTANKRLNAIKLGDPLYLHNFHLEFEKDSMEIGKSFKDLVSMIGVHYIYKRDYYWRTWRRILNGTKEDLIYYKSQSISEINCTICHSGFWIIEDKPPLCPYEITAMKNKEQLTVFTPNDPKTQRSISLIDLIRNCGNPIRTKMRLTFKNFSKRSAICQWREYCEINTFYSIYPEFVVFQIINSTNHVIYSKKMMAGNKHFINSFGNSGTTRPISDKNKNKRIKQTFMVNKDKFNTSNIKNKYSSVHIKPQFKTRVTKSNLPKFPIRQRSKLSPCKKLQLMQLMKENEDFHLFI